MKACGLQLLEAAAGLSEDVTNDNDSVLKLYFELTIILADKRDNVGYKL